MVIPGGNEQMWSGQAGASRRGMDKHGSFSPVEEFQVEMEGPLQSHTEFFNCNFHALF